jgi:hypothetical protein
VFVDENERRRRNNEKAKRWRDANRDKAVESSRRWYAENKKDLLAKLREEYAADPKRRERSLKWQRENPDKTKASRDKHRAACRKPVDKPKRRCVEKPSPRVLLSDEVLRANSRKRVQRWRAANGERVKERDRALRLNNPERYAANRYRWNAKHPGKASAYHRAWKRNNREQVRVLANRRRARKLKAGGHHTAVQVRVRVALFGGCCAYCRGPYEHLDHAIALAKGGTNWPANLRPSCAMCNSKKKDGDWRKWRVLL